MCSILLHIFFLFIVARASVYWFGTILRICIRLFHWPGERLCFGVSVSLVRQNGQRCSIKNRNELEEKSFIEKYVEIQIKKKKKQKRRYYRCATPTIALLVLNNNYCFDLNFVGGFTFNCPGRHWGTIDRKSLIFPFSLMNNRIS